MIHLTSEISDQGISMKFLKEKDIFEMHFSRVVIGVSFEEGLHAVTVGERAMWFDSRSEREKRAESLQNLEGLTFYREIRPHVAAQKWPSFRRFELRAGIFARNPPDETTIHRELEALSTSPVLDPESGKPLMGLDQEPVTQINMPGDFPNQNSFAGMRNGRIGPCTALWFACTGLETSRPPDPDRKIIPKELKGLGTGQNSITGY